MALVTWGTCQFKFSSACGILAYTVLRRKYCSRELEPDFVCFCFFFIGCHRNVSTALVNAFEPVEFTWYFFPNSSIVIYFLNPLFRFICKESLCWQCSRRQEGEVKEAWKLCPESMWETHSAQWRATFQYRDLPELFCCLWKAFLRIARPMPSAALHLMSPLGPGKL